MPELDELFDDDPSGEHDGFTKQVTIQLNRPFRDLAEHLAPEACADLAGLSPSQTRFRVHIELPPDKVPEDANDDEPLYGYGMLQAAKPVSVAGDSMLRYLRSIGATGNVAIEWLKPKGGKLLHFVQIPEDAPRRESERPRTVVDMSRAGDSQQNLMLVMLELMERKDRAAAERLDRMMAEMREQTSELIRAMRENDPVRELGQEMVRAGNEAVLTAVRDTVGRVAGRKSELSELGDKLRELESLKTELGPLLGSERVPEVDDIDQLMKLGTVINMFRGGGNNADVAGVLSKLNSQGEGILNSA